MKSKQPTYLKVVDAISFIIIVVIMGFGAQFAFLLSSPVHPLITILIPVGFAKFWYEAKENANKEYCQQTTSKLL